MHLQGDAETLQSVPLLEVLLLHLVSGNRLFYMFLKPYGRVKPYAQDSQATPRFVRQVSEYTSLFRKRLEFETLFLPFV